MTSRRDFLRTATGTAGAFGMDGSLAGVPGARARRPRARAAAPDDGANVRDHGAAGDGTTDDTDAIRAALAASDHVYFPTGRYRVTSPVVVGPRKRIVGQNGSLFSASRAELRGAREDLGDGKAILVLNPSDETDVQDILIEGLHLRGDNRTMSYRDLSTGEDVGVVGIDATNVKDHVVIRDCSFRYLKRGIGEREERDYTGQVFIDNCHFADCFRAIELTTTSHLSVTGSDIRECVDWIAVSAASVLNCVFNNSSFSRERCGLKTSRQLIVVGTWFEGGNHVIDMTRDGANVTLLNSYLGATYSRRGSTRYHVWLAPGWFFATGNQGARYTRTFDFPDDPGPAPERYVIRLLNNDFREPIRFKYGGWDPDVLGFDYFGDDSLDTRSKSRTVVVDGVPGGATRVVTVAPLGAAGRYQVGIMGSAGAAPAPRICQEDRVLTRAGDDGYHVARLLEDNAGATVEYRPDEGGRRLTLALRNTSRAALDRVVVRVTALGSPLVVEAP